MPSGCASLSITSSVETSRHCPTMRTTGRLLMLTSAHNVSEENSCIGLTKSRHGSPMGDRRRGLTADPKLTQLGLNVMYRVLSMQNLAIKGLWTEKVDIFGIRTTLVLSSVQSAMSGNVSRHALFINIFASGFSSSHGAFAACGCALSGHVGAFLGYLICDDLVRWDQRDSDDGGQAPDNWTFCPAEIADNECMHDVKNKLVGDWISAPSPNVVAIWQQGLAPKFSGLPTFSTQDLNCRVRDHRWPRGTCNVALSQAILGVNFGR